MNITNIQNNNINQYKAPIIDITKRTASNFAGNVLMNLNYFDKHKGLIVATVDGKVTGFVQFRKLCLCLLDDSGYNHNNYRLEFIVVDKNHQHKGIGQALFNQAVKQLKEMGAETVDLIYNKDEDLGGRLTRFYTQLGKSEELSSVTKVIHSSTIVMKYYFKPCPIPARRETVLNKALSISVCAIILFGLICKL